MTSAFRWLDAEIFREKRIKSKKMIHKPRNNRNFTAPKWAAQTRTYEFRSGGRVWIFMSNQERLRPGSAGLHEVSRTAVSTGNTSQGPNCDLAPTQLPNSQFFRAVMQCSKDPGLVVSWGPFLNVDSWNHSLRFGTPVTRTQQSHQDTSLGAVSS